MSAPPRMRRAEKSMPDERARAVLESGFCGRLAAIGSDGYPYCVPLLHVASVLTITLAVSSGPSRSSAIAAISLPQVL